jgi:AcrR family transcriptional regulator
LNSKTAKIETFRPRRPERANGRKRYEQLLEAAERLLDQSGSSELTIQNVAREAEVPMASVYHFFPSPAAISVALAESYLSGFAALVREPIPNRAEKSWQEIIAILIERTVEFYRAHPYAQTLVLGSDHSWHIRKADLDNNRVMADVILDHIRDKFALVETRALWDAIMVGISLSDAVLSLSIAEQEVITRHYASEAVVAVCGYLSGKFGR